ncbi:MAG: SUMF1/EgtB/PvdO family nonheme iron enzyme, partial [Chloroflexi bacterium]|nr:SUMF1/EgtB/PvdO family nonheme iron enzyme [Chloroflexota bacterium]
LTTAILHNPGIKQLATNPLLLTILVLMQRQGIVLPARRVELYEQYIATLIRHWNFARGLGRARSRDLDVIETLRVLAPLALWLQETNPGIGAVSQRVMQRQLAEIYHQRGMDEPERLAAQFLEDVRLYAGLLLVREPGEYGFLHRTFQEYLAALAIVQQGQRDPTPIIRKIVDHVNTDGWHEILRLAIGILGVLQQRDEVVADICERLIAEATGASVVLAGDAVVDVWPGGVTMAGRTAVIHALQTTMKNEKISAPYRMGAAAALGRLSVDDMAVLPLTVTAVDQMPFCLVPNGSFWLGEADYRQYYEALAAPYWIAQYPITNAQFAQFIADGGYQVPAFWTEAAAVERWQDGQVMDWESRGWRKRPFDYGDPFSLPNHPVVGICWYEALAFTRWLTQRWQAAGLLSMDGQIMLPSEVEWEKAARGGVDILNDPVVCEVAQVADEWDVILQENVAGKRPFPWGEAAPDNHAHFNVHHWRGTCAVGCYPSGASPYGCAGMSGNVWEWTRSLYEPFPYLPGDGRESTEIKLFHNLVLKGGAFWVDEKRIRCSSRFRRAPNDRFNNYGFRVVIKEGKGLSVED